MARQYNPQKTVRQGKRIASQQVRQSVTRDESERWSAAWHWLDLAGKNIRAQQRRSR